MTKKKIKQAGYLFPMPVVVIGANVKDKPNFLAVGWVGIVEHKPHTVLISLGQSHYTNIGIKENETFSVNTPSVDMVKAVDYVGIVTGKEVDKSDVFEVFYGDLKTAPMITEAPLNLECKLAKTIDLGKGNDIFLGEVINAYTTDEFLTNDVLDIKKIKPFVLSVSDYHYYGLGDTIGRGWSIGKDYKK